MQRCSWLWLLVVLVVVPVLSARGSAEAQQGESVGTVTALEGRATVQHYGSSTAQALQLQSPVYLQDVIRTEAASKLQVTFIDDTRVNLGEEGTLEVTRFVYAPQKQRQTAVLTISMGVFRALVRKLLPQTTFEVTTPTAIAAIRGTDFMGEVKPDAAAFVALEGTVALFSVGAIFRGVVTLTEGMGSTVRSDQPPSPPTKWTAEHIDHLRRATAIR